MYAIKTDDGYIVGESALTPEQRFAKHLKGDKSKHVDRDGLRLLGIDWRYTKTGVSSDREVREKVERKLAHKLYNEGHRVYGNGLPRNKRGR